MKAFLGNLTDVGGASVNIHNIEIDFVQCALGVGEESYGRLNAELSAEIVREEYFEDSGLWRIFSAARECAARGQSLSAVVVAASMDDALRKRVYELWPAVPQLSGLRLLLEALRERHVRRSAIKIGKEIIRAAEDDDGKLDELVGLASSLAASRVASGSGITSGDDVLLQFFDDIESSAGGRITPTHIGGFDHVLDGIPSRFITIFGAYPGCYKSGLMATIASNWAACGIKVGFMSLEDHPIWIAKRFVSRESGVPVTSINSRKLDPVDMARIAASAESVSNIMKNIVFDGRSNLTGIDVAASCRFMIFEKGAKAIIIDHIGEVRANFRRKDRYDLEIAEIVRNVRDVAKDTGIPIILAAHLKRRESGEDDINRPPSLTDFSDSSSIEKMCRLAVGLFQPKDRPNEIGCRVLKSNESGARGTVFYLEKDAKSALIKN